MNREGERMRTFLFAAAAAMTVIATPADSASRNFGITGFEKIRIEGPFNVKLTTDVAPFASASGSPNALDRVAIEVRGNTLVVHSNLGSWGGYPGQTTGPVEVTVGTHDLSSAWTSGSGALTITRIKGLSFDLSVQGSGSATVGSTEVDQLSISVVGTGNATLAGSAAKLTAVVRGVSSLNAGQLTTKDATLGADGAATIDANVSNSATIDANGPATVRLTGAPACTVRANGSASVTGCKSTH